MRITARMPTRLPRLLLLLCLLLAPTARASDSDEADRKLKQVRKDIAALQQRINRQQAEKGTLRGELREVELAIAGIVRKLQTLSGELVQRQEELSRLKLRSVEASKQLDRHRDSLQAQIRAAYRIGQTPVLQLLLNQEDPARVSRALRYYDYYNRARLDAIDEAESLLRELDELSRREREASGRLEAARQATEAQRVALQGRQQQRAQVLARLETELKASGGKLQSLRGDETRLQNLLDQLSQLLADIPPPPREQEPFRKRRGKLPWPVEGRILSGFNAQRGDSPVRWQGLVINAGAGTEVRAVHHGHVVFADWLQGFGLITIVDHGGGYMTLYGNNEALHKDTGDWIASGETIATAGDGGGQLSTGVYFEIRRNGRPLNPKPWLR